MLTQTVELKLQWCHKNDGKLWKLSPHTFTCGTSTNIINFNTTIFKSNTIKPQQEAFWCIKKKEKWDYYTDILGNHYHNITELRIAITNKECNQMINKNKCNNGIL